MLDDVLAHLRERHRKSHGGFGVEVQCSGRGDDLLRLLLDARSTTSCTSSLLDTEVSLEQHLGVTASAPRY